MCINVYVYIYMCVCVYDLCVSIYSFRPRGHGRKLAGKVREKEEGVVKERCMRIELQQNCFQKKTWEGRGVVNCEVSCNWRFQSLPIPC